MALKPIWYSGYELKKRWSISERDLIHYLIAGELIAYKSPGSEPYSKEYIKQLDQNDYWQFMSDHGPWGFSYHTDNVLEFEKLHNITVGQDEDKNEIKTSVAEKKLRPNQADKLKCQEIARGVWKEHLLDIKYMKMHPDIKKIVGRLYTDGTVHGWISEVAPDEVSRKSRRSKDYVKNQLAICKKLKIEVPKK